MAPVGCGQKKEIPRDSLCRRVAQAFNLAGIFNAAGAPSLRVLCARAGAEL